MQPPPHQTPFRLPLWPLPWIHKAPQGHMEPSINPLPGITIEVKALGNTIPAPSPHHIHILNPIDIYSHTKAYTYTQHETPSNHSLPHSLTARLFVSLSLSLSLSMSQSLNLSPSLSLSLSLSLHIHNPINIYIHIQRHIHKYVYTIYIHIHMYTRIPNEKGENILRVRGQESWASTMLIGSIHDSNILIESIRKPCIRATWSNYSSFSRTKLGWLWRLFDHGKRCTGEVCDTMYGTAKLIVSQVLRSPGRTWGTSCT